MSIKKGSTVTFKAYEDENLEDSERIFEAGDSLTLVGEDEEAGTKDNPCFLAQREDGKQGYVFGSEVSEPEEESEVSEPEGKGKGKRLRVKKGKSEEPDAEESEGSVDLVNMGKAIDEGTDEGDVYLEAMVKASEERGIDPDDYETWEELGKVLSEPETEGVPEEEQVEEPKHKAGKVKTKKAAPAKVEQPKVEQPEVEELKHSPSVKKLVGTQASALAAAKKISDRVASDFYLLGGVLSEIKRQRYYESVTDSDGNPLQGQPGFEAYVLQELGIEYRMAQHYLNVYEVTRAAGIAESKVKDLKYTKVVALLSLIKQGAITKENWDEWHDKAKTLKGDAYRKEVEEAQVEAGITKNSRGVTANKVRFNFVLFDDRAKVVQKALKKAKGIMPPNEDGTEPTDSEAFDYIVSEWVTSLG
jgi:hypothetical protein